MGFLSQSKTIKISGERRAAVCSYPDMHLLMNAVRSAISIFSSIARFSQIRIFGTWSLGIIFSIAEGCLVIGSATERPFDSNKPPDATKNSSIAERDIIRFLKLPEFAVEKSRRSSKSGRHLFTVA
jgi:hypothetical protein